MGCLCLLVAMEYLKEALSPRWPLLRLLPSALLVLLLAVLLSYSLRLDQYGLQILGDVDGGFPFPAVPPLSDFALVRQLFSPALFIAVIGFVESMAVAKKYAAIHRYTVSTNRELVALGASNLLGSFFGAYPAFASLSRSSVSDLAGASSQFVGLFASCVVLLTILFLMPLFYYLPKAAIAAIILFAAYRLIHLHDLQLMWRAKAWADVALYLVTLLCTFCFGPEIGIVVAILISLFFILKYSTVPHLALLGQVQDDLGRVSFEDVMAVPSAKMIPGVILAQVNDSLFFPNVAQFKEMLSRAERLGRYHAHPTEKSLHEVPVHAVIVDACNIQEIDPQAATVIVEMLRDYNSRNLRFAFVQMKPQLRRQLLTTAHFEDPDTALLGPHTFFPSIPEAIEALSQQQSQSSHAASAYHIL